MRISAKGRYALAAMIDIARNSPNGESITVVSISERLGISKIYLEQVFSLLKRGALVSSVKGSQGGYLLTRMPRQITVYAILSAVELSLFEPTEESVAQKAPEIETALRLSAFQVLDEAVRTALEKITLDDLVSEAERQKKDQGLMFYI